MIDAGDIEAIAQRVAELIRDECGTTLVDTATAARRLGVSEDYVRDHADELGAVRLGDGPKARLRFDLDRALAALGAKPSPSLPPKVAPTRRRKPEHVDLLPIGGKP